MRGGVARARDAPGQRREYLKRWRHVRKDKSIKAVPDYFALARHLHLDTSAVTSPLNRNALRHLSQVQNLLHTNGVMRLNKSIGRNSFRSDGIVPTLTCGCTRMFVPSAASLLTVPQLLCLSGVHPERHPDVVELASRTIDFFEFLRTSHRKSVSGSGMSHRSQDRPQRYGLHACKHHDFTSHRARRRCGIELDHGLRSAVRAVPAVPDGFRKSCNRDACNKDEALSPCRPCCPG